MGGSARRERDGVGCDRVVTRRVEVVGWCLGHGRLESETAAVGPGGVRWVPGGDSVELVLEGGRGDVARGSPVMGYISGGVRRGGGGTYWVVGEDGWAETGALACCCDTVNVAGDACSSP